MPHSHKTIACPSCGTNMDRDGACPDCGHRDNPHCDCKVCSEPVFTHCNVCGDPLRGHYELSMGMCSPCADD